MLVLIFVSYSFVGNNLTVYRSTLKIFFSVFLVLTVSFVYAPRIVPVILLFNFVLLALISYLKVRLIYRSDDDIIQPLSKKSVPPLFISIQIPICSEPALDVIRTIKAAASQDYKFFEVIVLYNNTNDRSLIDPVAEYCETLDNVRFFNRPNLKGFKAGALNVARRLMDNRANYILTLDADYILESDALLRASEEFRVQHLDVLQFPQSYCNHEKGNSLAAEFNHYFKAFSHNSNKYNGSLPTGTLTLVSAECIDIINGWPESSITEDAFMGVELLRKNCALGYSDTVIGHGKMPSSVKDLKQQRMRWIFGNFQTFIHALKYGRRLGFKGNGTFAQLTSWINLIGLPLIVLILVGVFSGLLEESLVRTIYTISFVSVVVHVLTQIVIFYKARYRGIDLVNALLTNTASSLDGAFVWWGYFLNKDRPFTRTNKFLRKVGTDPEAIILIVLVFLSSLILTIENFIGLGVLNLMLGVLLGLSRIELKIALMDANSFEKKPAL